MTKQDYEKDIGTSLTDEQWAKIQAAGGKQPLEEGYVTYDKPYSSQTKTLLAYDVGPAPKGYYDEASRTERFTNAAGNPTAAPLVQYKDPPKPLYQVVGDGSGKPMPKVLPKTPVPTSVPTIGAGYGLAGSLVKKPDTALTKAMQPKPEEPDGYRGVDQPMIEGAEVKPGKAAQIMTAPDKANAAAEDGIYATHEALQQVLGSPFDDWPTRVDHSIGSYQSRKKK